MKYLPFSGTLAAECLAGIARIAQGHAGFGLAGAEIWICIRSPLVSSAEIRVRLAEIRGPQCLK
jgi:hypothetical protein